MKNRNPVFLTACLAIMFVAPKIGIADSLKNDTKKPEECLNKIKSVKSAKKCFEDVFVKIEAKRLVLEKRAPLEMPDVSDLKDGLEWNAEYDAAAADSRIFFEQYRLAECARRQLLQLETALTGYERELCMIELTSERISTLTPKSMNNK